MPYVGGLLQASGICSILSASPIVLFLKLGFSGGAPDIGPLLWEPLEYLPFKGRSENMLLL